MELNSVPKSTKFDSLSKEEIIQKYTVVEDELARVVRELYLLKGQKLSDEQLKFILAEQVESLTETIYGKKSERYKKSVRSGDGDDGEPKTPAKDRVKKLSDRYPNISINEQFVEIEPIPACPCCKKTMIDSDMFEVSEQLTVIPKKYEILRTNRVKYVCSCHGAIVTADPLPRIIEGSSYSNEMITDIALSKYCDLIPINRYVKMADRGGLIGLPANSLIETTHAFADFVSPVYKMIKQGILNSRVLRADETPHLMLEGDEKDRWYLWGFSTESLCFLECRDTRSGDIASEILVKSKCEVLVSDVYSGYGKAIRITNEVRESEQKSLIRAAHCNAHARRNFFKMWPKYKEAQFYLDHFHEIYQLNAKAKGQAPPEILNYREQMRPRFEAMKKRAMEELGSYSLKGKYARALKYYLKNYDTLTFFLQDAETPIDNNAQERNLRSHVIGRKSWYGTHSKRGALTAAIMFSIIETCKLVGVNPRQYFQDLVQDLLNDSAPYTPADYKKSH